MSLLAPTESKPVTLRHVKGTSFTASITFSGFDLITSPTAKIVRRGDPDQTSIGTLAVSADGNTVTLTASDADLPMPPGWYEVYIFGVADGAQTSLIGKSTFIQSLTGKNSGTTDISGGTTGIQPIAGNTINFTGVSFYEMPWTAQDIAYYGNYPVSQVFQADGAGGFELVAVSTRRFQVSGVETIRWEWGTATNGYIKLTKA